MRINNVTYSSNHFLLPIPLVNAGLICLGSNMFAAGFADTELRRTILSGMDGPSAG
jgi:hypothetical protein